jgi:hypothetical protein
LWLSGCGDNDPERAVAAMLPDPASARFQSVSRRGDHVCGEVNGRAARGGYTGYTRFVYDSASGVAALDPRLMAGPSTARPTKAACTKPVAYQTIDERFICAEAPAPVASADIQLEFNSLWQRNCG